MRPSQKGWIRNYTSFLGRSLKSTYFDLQHHKTFRDLNNEKKLYKLIQPSGLMYGHPVRPSIASDLSISRWNEREKMKFILLDCLLNEAILFSPSKVESKDDFDEYIQDRIKSISEFYRQFLPTQKILRPKYLKDKSKSDLVESIIESRIHVKTHWTKNFWCKFFENSLLFLDVYHYSKWCTQKNNIKREVKLKEKQEDYRFKILQVIAAAAYANKKIETEERALFNFFLSSADLSKEKELLSRELLNHETNLENVMIDLQDPWIIKKYLLELAILTIWADKKIEDVEKEFVKQLAEKLGFSDDELEGSFLAVESFVISNWHQIHFLQSKHAIVVVKDRFKKHLAHIVNKNKNAFVQEIRESKELMNLMLKMSKEKLSEKEKTIVKAQLMDILKTLPTFVIIALPGTFITLPLLLNLLPKSAFPSAFSQVD